jgi:hypothetical protein
VDLGDGREARGSLDRVRTGVDGFLLAVVRLFALLFLVRLHRGRDYFALGRVLRLGDHVRAFGSMKPTIIDRRPWPA